MHLNKATVTVYSFLVTLNDGKVYKTEEFEFKEAAPSRAEEIIFKFNNYVFIEGRLVTVLRLMSAERELICYPLNYNCAFSYSGWKSEKTFLVKYDSNYTPKIIEASEEEVSKLNFRPTLKRYIDAEGKVRIREEYEHVKLKT